MKILVTGASEGIGRSFAQAFAKQGHSVCAVARTETRLRELVSELGSGGHSYVVADLADSAGVDRVCQELRTQKFDLLINNAGFATYGVFSEAPLVDANKMMSVNCESLLRLSHAFLSGAVSGDALINVSSSASFLPMPIASVYTGSKAFVTAFTEALWFEARKNNIYVMALCPGLTKTKFHTRAGGQDEQMPGLMTQTPEQVVSLAMRELRRRRKPVVISGLQKYMVFAAKFLPRKWVTLLAGNVIEHFINWPL